MLFCGALKCRGTPDPQGDIHPVVNVEDGRFVIYCNTPLKDGEMWAMSRTTYSPEGKLLTPTERVTAPKWKEIISPPDKPDADRIDAGPASAEGGSKDTQLWFLSHANGKPTHTPLHLPEMSWDDVPRVVITSDYLVFVYSTVSKVKKQADYQAVPLAFSLISRPKFIVTKTIQLGECAEIYDSAVSSNIVQAGNRFWFAWVRPAENLAQREFVGSVSVQLKGSLAF